jgi:ribosomal protein S18 acetylase RimI-like enzyme
VVRNRKVRCFPNSKFKQLDYDAQFIRPATEPYFPAIMHLISQEDYGQSDPRYAKWVALAAKTDIILVAAAPPDHPFVKEILGTITDRKFPPPDVVGGEIIMGVGFATPGDNYGWMYGLYVHPAFRNSGVGKSIVMARLAALRQMGIDNAITEIAEWNTPANKIYEKLHAEKTGKISLIGSSQPKVRVRRH